MSGKLHLAWVSSKAARFAVEHWHYSRALPAGKIASVGVWEDDKYIGAVIFGSGANMNMVKPWGLKHHEGIELVRVALNKHSTPVTRIISIAIKLYKKRYPATRLIVSFADMNQGHEGIIYQAGNWLYTGPVASSPKWLAPDGKEVHNRRVTKSGYMNMFGEWSKTYKKDECKKIPQLPKHRYVYPLDKEIRSRIKVVEFRAGSIDSDALGFQPKEGGADPTPAL